MKIVADLLTAKVGLFHTRPY